MKHVHDDSESNSDSDSYHDDDRLIAYNFTHGTCRRASIWDEGDNRLCEYSCDICKKWCKHLYCIKDKQGSVCKTCIEESDFREEEKNIMFENLWNYKKCTQGIPANFTWIKFFKLDSLERLCEKKIAEIIANDPEYHIKSLRLITVDSAKRIITESILKDVFNRTSFELVFYSVSSWTIRREKDKDYDFNSIIHFTNNEYSKKFVGVSIEKEKNEYSILISKSDDPTVKKTCERIWFMDILEEYAKHLMFKVNENKENTLPGFSTLGEEDFINFSIENYIK